MKSHYRCSVDARMKGCFLIPLYLLIGWTCSLSQGFCFSKNAHGIGRKSISLKVSLITFEASTVSILSKQKVIGGGYYHRVSAYTERTNAMSTNNSLYQYNSQNFIIIGTTRLVVDRNRYDFRFVPPVHRGH